MSYTYGEYVTMPGTIVAGDISSSQYKFVRHSTTAAKTIVAVGATTEVLAGVLMNAPDASGEPAEVAVSGVVVMVAGTSTITAGAALSSDATGRAITGGAITGAKAAEDAGAVGDLIRVSIEL